MSFVPSTLFVTLTGATLTTAQLVRVARGNVPALLAEAARAAVERAAAALARHAAQGTRIYGLTTGVGALEGCDVDDGDGAAQQRNLWRSHAAGVGAPLPDAHVRAMVLARANALARGHSGASPALLEALLALLARGVVPVVPEAGSVGASDLAPLAHVGLALLGEGRARFQGHELPAGEALARAGLGPLVPRGRDALALINGLAHTAGTGALAVHDAARLLRASETVAAMTLLGARAPRDFLDARLDAARAHAGTAQSARRLRTLVGDARAAVQPGARAPCAEGRPAEMRTRLSSRYAPAVFGAARDAVAACERAVEAELNAAVDNPFVDDDWLTSNSGTTSGQVVGATLDNLVTAVVSLAVISERRTASLLDPAHNGGLPAFLVHPRARAGVHFGLMAAQYTAAALVGELRARAAPTTVQSVPLCAGTEDHASMSALAARRAAWAVEAAEAVVAVEALCAAQAMDLAGATPPAALEPAYRAVRERAPVWVEDRVLARDLEQLVALVREGALGGAGES